MQTGYTPVKKWIRYVALHPGVIARKAGWDEELVARLKKDNTKEKGSSGCVLGPFTTAESLWSASHGKAGFKLGMSLMALKMWMRRTEKLRGGWDEGEGVYVYRFYPAEPNKDLVWTNDAYHLGDDWSSGFVRSRNQRGRGGIRFYVRRDKKKVRNGGNGVNDGGLSRAQWLVLQAQRRAPTPSAPEMLHQMVEEDHRHAQAAPNVQMPQAFLRQPENQMTVEMARRTEEMARAFRELGRQNGMDVVVVIALEKMEEALAKVGGALVDGSLHGLTVSLFDLRMAIDEYGWAINLCGWDAGYVVKVRDLSRVIGGIERGVEHSLHLMALANMGDV